MRSRFALFRAGSEGIRSSVARGTHEVGVEFVGRVAYVVVRPVVQRSFGRDDGAVVSPVPTVIGDHLRGLFEALDRLLKEVVRIVVDVELHDRSTSQLHTGRRCVI